MRKRILITIFVMSAACAPDKAQREARPSSSRVSLVAKGVSIQMDLGAQKIAARGDEMRLAEDGRRAVLKGRVRARTDGPLSLEVSAERLELDFEKQTLALVGQVVSRFEMPKGTAP